MKKFLSLLTIVLFITTVSFSQKSTILLEGFEGGAFPDFWSYQDVIGGGSWQYQTGGANGGAYPSTAHSGTYNACYRGFPNPSLSKLVTPALDLTNGGTLNFWWASHTYFGPGDIDYLTVYYKEGAAGSWNQLAAYQDGADDWTEATFNIPSTSNEVYIAFEGSYQGGMGVCIDDVYVFNSDTDLGVDEIQPSLAFGTETTPTVTVHNYGLVEASNYEVSLEIAGTTYSETMSTNPNIPVGGEVVLSFPTWTLPTDGSYNMTATVTIAGDAVSSNDVLTHTCIIDQTPFGNAIGYFDAGFAATQDYHCAFPETDGENIYVGSWNSNRVARFTMEGNPLGDYFTLGDIAADDLAYDGEYFYSGDVSENQIYAMDFTDGNEQIVATYSTTFGVSALAYCGITNTFWANDGNSMLTEYNPDGSETGNYISLGGNYLSGMAIDEFSDPANPTIWTYRVQVANVVDKLVEYDFDGNPTGQEIPVNSTQFPALVDDNDQGGGLACYVNEQNQVILLVGVQHLVDTYEGRIIFVYLDEAAETYEATIKVVDQNSNPIENASVTLAYSKFTALTDANGEATFDLQDGNYDFIVEKDCFDSEIGNFTISGASPTIDDVVLNVVAAPIMTDSELLEDGQTIELTFSENMNLNGEVAPNGFSVYAGEELTINGVTVDANVITITVDELIYGDAQVTVSYTTTATVQSESCGILLEAITDYTITNNSTYFQTVITVEDENSEAIENASVTIENGTKDVQFTDANGQVSFDLVIGSYNFLVEKDCYLDENGSFTITNASPSIDNVVLMPVADPQLVSAEVLSDGYTIELNFDQNMNLNGETAPAGFTVDADGALTISDISANEDVITLTITELILGTTDISISYSSSDATIQSQSCGYTLQNITDYDVTNNSNFFEAMITVVDQTTEPVENASVTIENSTKDVDFTDANGEVTFVLEVGDYDYLVGKDCFVNSEGSFTISTSSQAIDDIELSSVDAPTLVEGEVLSDGQTIELTFSENMNLNGEDVPAGFSVYADEELTINNISVADEVVTLNIDEIIATGTAVTVSYSASTVQSADCGILLEDIVDNTITNNSTVIVDIKGITENLISIYPNPTHDYIYLSNNANIELLDMTGKIILEKSNVTDLDLSDLNNGIYLIKITTNIETTTHKIIKK